MMSALSIFLFGAITLAEQTLKEPYLFTFVRADFNQDGKPDLLFPDAVCFQRDGGFPKEGRVELPDIPESARTALPPGLFCDAWKDSLFYCTSRTLHEFKWKDGAWNLFFEQKLEFEGVFPKDEELVSPDYITGVKLVNLSNFLNDANGDGVPEIITLAKDGIHFYARGEKGYSDAAVINILSKPEYDWSENQNIRSLEANMSENTHWFPKKVALSTFQFEENVLNFIAPDEQKHSIITHLELDSAFKPIPEKTTLTNAGRGCILQIHKNGHVDYIMSESRNLDNSILPISVYRYSILSSQGEEQMAVEAQAINSLSPFVDFNNDGRLDIAVETTELFLGGVKETVARVMSALKIKGEIDIYLQNEDGSGSKQPSIRFPFTRELDEPIGLSGYMPRLGIFSLEGDFNGDDAKDLAIFSAPNKLDIHLFNGSTFDKTPACAALVDLDILHVDDMDGDGKSDVFFCSYNGGNQRSSESKLFLTREATK
jgi:hypothetical protein